MKLNRTAFLLLLILSTTIVWANTVMLYTEEAEESRFFALAGLDYVAAVEDGVMDVFFDAGHIIFNYGLSETSRQNLPVRADRPLRAARSGGAGFLIEIELHNPVDDGRVPHMVEYAYSDVISGQLLASGHIRLDEVDDGSIGDARELCVAVGRAVAMAALVDR